MRGRPRGSGYDDRDRIEVVTDAMRSGLSRRAAILGLYGPDQLRRIEMKMRALTVDGSFNARFDALVFARLKRMGLTGDQLARLKVVSPSSEWLSPPVVPAGDGPVAPVEVPPRQGRHGGGDSCGAR